MRDKKYKETGKWDGILSAFRRDRWFILLIAFFSMMAFFNLANTILYVRINFMYNLIMTAMFLGLDVPWIGYSGDSLIPEEIRQEIRKDRGGELP